MRNIVLVVSTVLLTGCFTTSYQSRAEPAGLPKTSHQWFTFGGLVPLSSADGGECKYGLAYAESQIGPADILLNIGLSIAGTLASMSVCSDVRDFGSNLFCTTVLSSGPAFLLAGRTTKYACAKAPQTDRRLRQPKTSEKAPPRASTEAVKSIWRDEPVPAPPPARAPVPTRQPVGERADAPASSSDSAWEDLGTDHSD